MTTIDTLARALGSLGSAPETYPHFDVQPIPGEIEVLKITIEDAEELPIFLSVADTQILCIAYLWKESEVKEERKIEMLEAMLDMNIPMPLSSFARIEDQYVVYGALSIRASIEEVLHELEVLSNNSVAAIRIMAEFLK